MACAFMLALLLIVPLAFYGEGPRSQRYRLLRYSSKSSRSSLFRSVPQGCPALLLLRWLVSNRNPLYPSLFRPTLIGSNSRDPTRKVLGRYSPLAGSLSRFQGSSRS